MKKLLSLGFAAVLATFCAATIQAAEKKPAPAEKDDKKVQHFVLSGKIASVDHVTKRIKIGERTFQVVSATKFTKAGKPATIDDAKAGEEVGGSYYEREGGKLELGSLRIGPKPEKAPKTEKAPKEEKK